jgi:hypothetical protein
MRLSFGRSKTGLLTRKPGYGLLCKLRAVAQPTPVIGLAVSGMNDVLNSQGYTQAAWWNRIPIAAWALMAVIAICANVLVGYSTRRTEARGIHFLVYPLFCPSRFFL